MAFLERKWPTISLAAKISATNLFTRLNYWIVACGGQPVLVPSLAWRIPPPLPSSARVTPSPSSSTRPSPTTAASSWSSRPLKASPTVSPVPQQGRGHQDGRLPFHLRSRHPCRLRRQARRPQRCSLEDLLPLLLGQHRHRRKVRHHARRMQVGPCCRRRRALVLPSPVHPA